MRCSSPPEGVCVRPSLSEQVRPRAQRCRAKTAPEGAYRTIANGVTLRPPSTPRVRRFLEREGPSATLLDLALDIVKRLGEVPDSDAEELFFLHDCLIAGSGKTVMPCVLLDSQNSVTEAIHGRSGGARDHEIHCFLRQFTSVKHAESSAIQGPLSRLDAKPSTTPSMRCSSDGMQDFGQTSPSAPMCARPIGSDLAEYFKSLFGNWSLDAYEVSKLSGGLPIQAIGHEALRRCCSGINFDQRRVQCFLESVEAMYGKEGSVLYHNNVHAADVTHLVCTLLTTMGFGNFFDQIGTLVLVVGAIVHDMGHDGKSNAFHVAVQSHIALTYNDNSVMENYHASQAFKLIKRGAGEANIFSGLTGEQITRTRRGIIDVVLNTDMVHHFSNTSSVKNFIDKLDDDPADWRSDSSALPVLQNLLLHAADISNPAKPAALSEKWTHLLKEEFLRQGDEEKELRIPVSPLCDRDTVNFGSSQVGFIQFIVQPTFSTLSLLQPLDDIMQEISNNTSIWEALKREEEAGEASGANAKNSTHQKS